MHTIKSDGHKYFIHLAQAKGNSCINIRRLYHTMTCHVNKESKLD